MLAATVGLSLVGLAGAAGAETLGDAVALAYQTNPTVQAQRASQRALDESYVQARTGFRPSASVTATVGRQVSGGVSGDNNSSSITLNVDQPLYTGGRVASQVTAAESDVMAGRENLRRVEIGLLQQVI